VWACLELERFFGAHKPPRSCGGDGTSYLVLLFTHSPLPIIDIHGESGGHAVEPCDLFCFYAGSLQLSPARLRQPLPFPLFFLLFVRYGSFRHGYLGLSPRVPLPSPPPSNFLRFRVYRVPSFGLKDKPFTKLLFFLSNSEAFLFFEDRGRGVLKAVSRPALTHVFRRRREAVSPRPPSPVIFWVSDRLPLGALLSS